MQRFGLNVVFQNSQKCFHLFINLKGFLPQIIDEETDFIES